MIDQQTKMSSSEAEKILYDLYQLKGTATELPGEFDFNFRITMNNTDSYVLKISRPNQREFYLDFQQKLLQYLEDRLDSVSPKIILDKNRKATSQYIDSSKNLRSIRLLSWISGRLWSKVNPYSNRLRLNLGEKCGEITKALQHFDHPEAHRYFEWDIAQSLWTCDYLALFDSKQKETVTHFQQRFKSQLSRYKLLRKTVVHNDVNDYNIIVSEDKASPNVIAIIDYGDAIYTQVINDLAVVCSYAIMHHKDPLEASLAVVKGYHRTFTLQEDEINHLFTCIAMRLVLSVTKSAINKKKEPSNNYLAISEKPAWELLKKWSKISEDFAHYSFRHACGWSAHPNETAFLQWATKQHFSLTDLFPSVGKTSIQRLDLSISSSWVGHQNDFNNIDLFQFKLKQLQKKHPSKIISGGYLEPRPLYTASTYDKIGNYGPENRTVHLGIDFWLPENTSVHALFSGRVVMAVNDLGDKEYGGLVILSHQEDGVNFFTLYGHLNPKTISHHSKGNQLQKGQQIGTLGDQKVNGNWAPHLHFQVMLSLLDYSSDFPGVAYPKQLAIWKSICVDPNTLFHIKELTTKRERSVESILKYRKQHLGEGLRLQYDKPLKIVRGHGVFLLDAMGNRYLDTVNNVAHVGHENFKVVSAGQEQMALLNTNTRYLHENINLLAKEILETLPKELSVLHFVNSGSEANELALRMVKCATNSDEMIVSEHGYHGHTNGTVALSSYKFDGKGGRGKPHNTHVFPIPDAFRGRYKGENTAAAYAGEVQILIDGIHQQNKKVGGLIVEPILSCGGQIELPDGFLSKAYESVRESGGLCISDEVQVGCGRLGKTFWGFELHGVIPDIVTIGKPLGNGHPIAAVACTKNVARKFANGMEFFNTFGGNPVSCAIALEVFQEIKRKKLQENALKVGEYFKSQLKELAKRFPIVRDVRGQGLFLGIELTDAHLNPLARQTQYLVNRMKDHGILMSVDGPDLNVVKIKPPIVFSKKNADQVLLYLKKILAEDVMIAK